MANQRECWQSVPDERENRLKTEKWNQNRRLNWQVKPGKVEWMWEQKNGTHTIPFSRWSVMYERTVGYRCAAHTNGMGNRNDNNEKTQTTTHISSFVRFTCMSWAISATEEKLHTNTRQPKLSRWSSVFVTIVRSVDSIKMHTDNEYTQSDCLTTSKYSHIDAPIHSQFNKQKRKKEKKHLEKCSHTNLLIFFLVFRAEK